tara:strand:+ start:366 stop:1139 length:774 start_codon:yes stop_codon:yes gene_type:complete
MKIKQNILQDIPLHNHSEPAVEIDRNEFIKLVNSRRSVRAYSEDQINSDDLRECLELALLAPTSSNLQCWEFYWIKNKEKKQKIKQYCLNQSAARTAQELIVCVARLDTWKKNQNSLLSYFKSKKSIPKSAINYYKNIVPIVYNQGPYSILGFLKKLLIFFIGLFRPIPREPTSLSDMRVWAHKTTALACENLMLAIRAFGYDSCPMEGMDSKRIQKMLNLPRKAEICMVISVGKRADNGVYGKRIRLNSNKFIKTI